MVFVGCHLLSFQAQFSCCVDGNFPDSYHMITICQIYTKEINVEFPFHHNFYLVGLDSIYIHVCIYIYHIGIYTTGTGSSS